MTELINGDKCRSCCHHTENACGNSNSDHYGHMITDWHQACGQYNELIAETKKGKDPRDGLSFADNYRYKKE